MPLHWVIFPLNMMVPLLLKLPTSWQNTMSQALLILQLPQIWNYRGKERNILSDWCIGEKEHGKRSSVPSGFSKWVSCQGALIHGNHESACSCGRACGCPTEPTTGWKNWPSLRLEDGPITAVDLENELQSNFYQEWKLIFWSLVAMIPLYNLNDYEFGQW